MARLTQEQLEQMGAKTLQKGKGATSIPNRLSREQLKQLGATQPQEQKVDQKETRTEELAKIAPRVKESIGRSKERFQEAMSSYDKGEQSLGETVLQGTGSVIGGASDIIFQGARTAAEAVTPERIEQGLERSATKVLQSEPSQNILERLQTFEENRPRAARNIGAVLEIGSIVPVGGAAVKGTQVAGKSAQQAGKGLLRAGTATARGVGKTAGFAGELALGSRVAKGLGEAFTSPQLVRAYRSGTRTIKDAAKSLKESTQDIASRSYARLERAKQSLPRTPIDREDAIGRVKRAIDDVGIIDEGNAARRVEKLEDIVENWKNWTPKGLLDLNTKIRRANLYSAARPDLQTSNNVIRDVTRTLKETAIENVKQADIRRQLQNASRSIEELEDIGYIFKTGQRAKPDQMNRALQMLGRKIDDANTRQDALDTMRSIKDKTGFDLEAELRAYKAAGDVAQDISQGDITSGIRQGIGRLASPVVEETGLLRDRLFRNLEKARRAIGATQRD